MLSFVKINLNGGLKRLASTLICLMMVLATFPMHMLSSTVRADGGVSIDLELGKEKTDGSEVKGWMGTGEPLDSATVPNAGDINITLTNDITVANEANKMDDIYFFNFTDNRFADKTITIDGNGKTIKIDNADLFFLSLKDCRVILKNITIDGGWIKGSSTGIERSGSFIYVSQPSTNAKSELVIEEGTTIQNCKRSSGYGGGIYNEGNLTINGGSITSCYAGNGGGILNSGTVTMNDNATISGCTAFSRDGGGIYVWTGTVTMNDNATISGCTASFYGGGIYVNSYGKVTMNDNATISGCDAYYGGGIASDGTVTMNDNATISDCTAKYGGGIYVWTGTVTMNGGKFIACSSSNGDAIFNYGGPLNLPPKEFGFLTITLTEQCYKQGDTYKGTQQCTSHNNDPAIRRGYEGIKSNNTPSENPNRKIVFVDSQSGKTVGSAYGSEEISVPNSVLARPGYEFVEMSYVESGGQNSTPITDLTDGKFTLATEAYGKAVSGVVTVKVKYNKLYTVQYICDNKVVGTKSGCSAETELSTIINTDFSKISLDGNADPKPNLASVVDKLKLKAKGYEFSNFTYGNGQPYTAETTWENLKDSAVDGLITVCVNHKRLYKVVATLSGFLGLDKSGVRGVYQH